MSGDGACSWCEQPAAGRLILKPGRGSKPPKTAPACNAHIKHFNKQGILTTEQALRSDKSAI